MPVRIRESKNINILDVEGHVDINSSDLIETVGWLTSTGKINIVLNLESVDMVDYNGLSILAIAYKNIVNHKGKMKLIGVSTSVMELFKVVKLDSVFDIYMDEESAVNSFFDKETSSLKLRRKFTRLDIHLTANYRIWGTTEGKALVGTILNISAAGMYIYTPDILPINTRIDAEIFFPGASKPFRSEGRVAWISDKEIQPHSYPGMGITFLHLDAESERLIIDFIDKNIIHRSE